MSGCVHMNPQESCASCAPERLLKAETQLREVVEAAKQLFTSIEIIERQAEVLGRRVQDDRPMDAILFECKRTRAALTLAIGSI